MASARVPSARRRGDRKGEPLRGLPDRALERAPLGEQPVLCRGQAMGSARTRVRPVAARRLEVEERELASRGPRGVRAAGGRAAGSAPPGHPRPCRRRRGGRDRGGARPDIRPRRGGDGDDSEGRPASASINDRRGRRLSPRVQGEAAPTRTAPPDPLHFVPGRAGAEEGETAEIATTSPTASRSRSRPSWSTTPRRRADQRPRGSPLSGPACRRAARRRGAGRPRPRPGDAALRASGSFSRAPPRGQSPPALAARRSSGRGRTRSDVAVMASIARDARHVFADISAKGIGAKVRNSITPSPQPRRAGAAAAIARCGRSGSGMTVETAGDPQAREQVP